MPSVGELSSFSVFSGVYEHRAYVSVQPASFSLCGAQATRNQCTKKTGVERDVLIDRVVGDARAGQQPKKAVTH